MRAEPIKEVWQAGVHLPKEQLLQSVLTDNGWSVVDIAYHHNLSESDCQKLRKTNTPTSLHYRTMPDFFVTRGNQSMYVELKVGNSTSTAYIEAFPLMSNILRETCLLVPTLYVYAGGITGGNMVANYSSCIKPKKLVVPARNQEIKPLLEKFYNGIPCQERETKIGTSGDAFVTLSKSQILSWIPLENYIVKN